MDPIRTIILVTGTVALLVVPPALGQSRSEVSGPILHTGVQGSYGHWFGQPGELESNAPGYGATIRYFAGTAAETRWGIGINWMRNRLDISDSYRAEGKVFTDRLTADRIGVDLYYGLPANQNNNVPYFLSGAGLFRASGDTQGGGEADSKSAYWETGIGIINGGSDYTAFAFELKYIRPLAPKIRRDDGIIELSLSVGYNW